MAKHFASKQKIKTKLRKKLFALDYKNPTTKIKVCIVCLSAYSLFAGKDCVGGAEVQLYQLGKKLSESEETEVMFLVGDYGQADVEKYGNIRVYKAPYNFKQNPPPNIINWSQPVGALTQDIVSRIAKRMRRFVSKKINDARFAATMLKIKPDIIITRTASPFIGIWKIISWILGAKFIHMLAHDWDADGTLEKKFGTIKGIQYRFGLKHANIVVAQSELQQQLLKKKYSKESIAIRSMYHIPAKLPATKRKYALWVGRSEEWKNPEMFLELARQFSNENFMMICPTSLNHQKYQQELKQKALAFPNIIWKDFVPFPEIDRYFSDAWLFVNTSQTEGFPNTFIQSMKNGTSILSFEVDPDRMVENNRCGVVCHGNVDEFRSAFGKLSKNKNLTITMGRNGYSLAKKQFDINTISRTYIKLMKQL